MGCGLGVARVGQDCVIAYSPLIIISVEPLSAVGGLGCPVATAESGGTPR